MPAGAPPVASAVAPAVAGDVRSASAPWDDAPSEHLDAPPDLGNEASVSSGAQHVEAWESGPPPGFDDGWGDGAGAASEASTSSESASAAAVAVGAGFASASASASASAPPVSPVSLARQLAELPPDPLSDRWAELVAQMQAQGLITALVRELAVQSQCVAQRQEGALSIWHLQVPRASLCGDMHKDRLTQALAQLLGCEVLLHVAQGAAVNTPAQRDLAAREARQHAAEALIEGDALVRGLLAQYPGARIVPGSVAPI